MTAIVLPSVKRKAKGAKRLLRHGDRWARSLRVIMDSVRVKLKMDKVMDLNLGWCTRLR